MSLTMALVQCNPTLGDIVGNRDMIIARACEAADLDADIVVFPEMVLSGYPLQDLANDRDILQQCEEALQEIMAEKIPAALVIGMPMPASMAGEGYDATHVMNALAVCHEGAIIARRFKHELPNTGVYDEYRNFIPGPLMGPVMIAGARIGFFICEDCWHEQVAECLSETGAEILIVINGSVYDAWRPDDRMQIVAKRVQETGLPLVYVNLTGGQDETVFDGGSFILDARCNLVCRMADFVDEMACVHWQKNDTGWQVTRAPRTKPLEPEAATYAAMMMGLRDYMHKNGFLDLVLGLSGGLDSALSATICVDALGADHVRALIMPTSFTRQSSFDDADDLAKKLGIRADVISIEALRGLYGKFLQPVIGDDVEGVVAENLQPRIRATLLMALANQMGALLLTTGNKSEMAVGYCTLYGDMAGGYSVLKDIYKTDVFALARWRNSAQAKSFGLAGAPIPESIITKPPSAELHPDQRDDDNLPPYDILDAILSGMIEKEQTAQELIEAGHDADTIARVFSLLKRAEHKRLQSPPGVKLTRRSFGRDWRFPLTNARKLGI
ncbi:MAG: NAD+ synthase [Pseudomonadota bacterium]